EDQTEEDIDDFDRQIQTLMHDLQVAFFAIALPTLARWLGRRLSMWAWTSYVQWYYQPRVSDERDKKEKNSKPQVNGSTGHSRHSSIASNHASEPPEQDARDSLETKLQSMIALLWQAAVTVYDSQANSDILSNIFTRYVNELNDLENTNESINIQIPIEALECLEEGGNPQLLLTEYLEELMAQEQQMKAKTDAVKSFKSELELALLSSEVNDDEEYLYEPNGGTNSDTINGH
ncbi:10206_t:CDS:2, partial [Ambispora gerdemannii]